MIKDIESKSNFTARLSPDDRDLYKETVEVYEEVSGKIVTTDRQMLVPLLETYLNQKKPQQISMPADIAKIKELSEKMVELNSLILAYEGTIDTNKKMIVDFSQLGVEQRTEIERLQSENKQLQLDLNANYQLNEKLTKQAEILKLSANQFLLELSPEQQEILINSAVKSFVSQSAAFESGLLDGKQFPTQFCWVKAIPKDESMFSVILWNYFILNNFFNYREASVYNQRNQVNQLFHKSLQK